MSTYNGTLKKWDKTGTKWDILYPKTTAANIISGTLDADRIPNLSADKITSGIFSSALIPAVALTNVTVTPSSLADYIAMAGGYTENQTSLQEGDVIISTADHKTYVHKGGATDGTVNDFYTLETPLDVIQSVNNKTGDVVLVPSDLGLGSVDNTADVDKVVASAGKLTTARNIAISGGATGSVSFDGSANVDIELTIEDDSHNHTIGNVDSLQGALDSKQDEIVVVTESFLSSMATIDLPDGYMAFEIPDPA